MSPPPLLVASADHQLPPPPPLVASADHQLPLGKFADCHHVPMFVHVKFKWIIMLQN